MNKQFVKKNLFIILIFVLVAFAIMSNKKEVGVEVTKVSFDDLCNVSFDVKNNTDNQVSTHLKLAVYDASSKAHAGGIVGTKAIKLSLNSKEVKNIRESVGCTPMRSTIMGADVFVLNVITNN